MLKKISIIAGATLVGLCLLAGITLVSALFYIESRPGSQLLQKTINARIPGTLTWETLTFSPTRGLFKITDAALVSTDNKPVATFKQLLLNVDLSALLNREVVINEFSIQSPTVTIEKNQDNTLNILKALTDAPSSTPPPPEPGGPLVLPFNVIAHTMAITHGSFSFISIPDAINVAVGEVSLQCRGNLEKKQGDLTLSTARGTIHLPQARTTVHRLNLSATFLKDALTDINVQLDTDTGNIALGGNAHSLFSNPEADINLTVDGDIARTLKSMENTSDVSGSIAARATVKGPINNPDVTLFLDYPGGEVLGHKINRAHIDIAMTDKICRIGQLLLDHDSGRINATGNVDLSRVFPSGFLAPGQHLDALAWDVRLDGKDIMPGTLLDTFDIKGIAGVCQLALTFSGGMSTPPAGNLTFKAAGAGYGSYPRADADIRLSLDRGTLTVKKCTLSSEPANLNLLGKIDLLEPGKMVPLKNPLFQLSLSSSPMALENLTPYISALKDQGLKGTLALKADMKGSKDVPKALVTLTAESIEVAGESVEKIDLIARLDLQKLLLENLDIHLGADRKIHAQGWADTHHQFDIKLNANGIPLSRFNLIRQKSPANGIFFADLSATGTFENPRLQGDIALKSFKVDGKPIEDFIASIDIKNQYATIKGRLNFDITAGFNLGTRDFKGNLTFKNTNLAPWFQLAGQEDISGNITGDIALDGNADTPDDINVHTDIKTISIALQEKFNITSTDIKAQLQGKTFKVAPFTTSLPEQGTLTLGAWGRVDGDITASATARIPVSVARQFAEDLPDLTGNLTLDATALIKKEIKNSRFNAQLSINDVGVTLPDFTPKIHSINGTILANRDQVEIKDITGFMDQGSFSITGKTSLTDFMPRAYTAKLKARSLPLTVPEGLDALFDVDLNLAGTMEKSALSGTIVLDSGELTREININKEIISAVTNPQRSRKGVNQQQESNPYLDNLTLDIFIQARNNFIIDTNLANMEIHPDLRIQGSPLMPVVSGRSTIDPGTLHHYNKGWYQRCSSGSLRRFYFQRQLS